MDNIKEGFQRDKEMQVRKGCEIKKSIKPGHIIYTWFDSLSAFSFIQENIKKFKEEAEKLEKSSAFKTARRQFGVLSAVKVTAFLHLF